MALVEVANLTKSFGSVAAVSNISFTITQGRCTALLGPNGAGKTTTLNILAGLLRSSAGEVAFEGIPFGSDHRGIIGYLPQQVAFPGWMTGFEYLRMVGELFGLSGIKARKRALDLLATLGLEEAGGRRIGGYSGGMNQRLGLSQAMVRHPRLLILDEPVSGLDPVGRRDLLDLLKNLKGESTILFSTHVLPDAEELSDDILIIRGGEIAVADRLDVLRERFEQPIIEIEFESEAIAKRWSEQFSDSVRSAPELRRNAIRYRYDSASAMREEAAMIYELIASNKAPVRRVELGQTTLEDLFLKVVGQ